MQLLERPSGLPECIPWKSWSGRVFNLLAPDPALILVSDIAHHLARTCRWSGGVPGHYSVAEHSLRIGLLVHPRFLKAARIHDAHEMPLGDVMSPLKALLPVYQWIAQQWDFAMCERFDVDYCELVGEDVRIADLAMRALERRYVLGDEPCLEDSLVLAGTLGDEWSRGTDIWSLHRDNQHSPPEAFDVSQVEQMFTQQLVDDLR